MSMDLGMPKNGNAGLAIRKAAAFLGNHDSMTLDDLGVTESLVRIQQLDRVGEAIVRDSIESLLDYIIDLEDEIRGV